ncbi:hypothetical protein [Aeromonas sp. ASNIH2]|uniref:hypothetical protein n=1 Tax=Aeromonas sp. ASNIH2 TaxID=1636607 RepID=UPI00131560FC|nr:hypothetical protein [Aeromonas sp. ASNIH2]
MEPQKDYAGKNTYKKTPMAHAGTNTGEAKGAQTISGECTPVKYNEFEQAFHEQKKKINEKRTSSKLKLLSATLMFFAAIFALILVRDYYRAKGSSGYSEIQSLKAAASTLPRMIDEETRWDSFSVSKKTASFNYTLVNYQSTKLNKSDFNKAVRPLMVSNFCYNMRKSIKNGMLIKVGYFGSDGDTISIFVIKKSDCLSSRSENGQSNVSPPPRPKI